MAEPGRDIDELIRTHKEEIDTVMQAMDPELLKSGGDEGTKYDEIFTLRFILSNKVQSNAISAMQRTLEWRSTDRAKRIINDIASGDFFAFVGAMERLHFVMHRCQCAAPLVGAVKNGGFMGVFRIGIGSPNWIYDNLSFSDNEDLQIALRESAFQQVDKIARTTRKMAKLYLVLDMKHASLGDLTDRRLMKVIGTVSKMAETYYPQLLAKNIILNCPSWFSTVMAMIRVVLPKKTMDKINTFTSPDAMWKSDWVNESFDKDKVPVELGGNLPDDQIPKTMQPNNLAKEHPMTEVDMSGRTTVEKRYTVKSTGSVIFEVYAKSNVEVGMSLVANGKTKELEATRPLKPSDGPWTGCWDLPKGEVVISFINPNRFSRQVLYEFTHKAKK